VYLRDGTRHPATGSGIFIREAGRTREISREEWDQKHPGCEPAVASGLKEEDAYSDNITHNLGTMAEAAGIYKHLWRPEDIGITTARQLIEPLRAGLELLRSDPERFKKLNPANGWGDYEGLVEFVERYLLACETFPEADVHASR